MAPIIQRENHKDEFAQPVGKGSTNCTTHVTRISLKTHFRRGFFPLRIILGIKIMQKGLDY